MIKTFPIEFVREALLNNLKSKGKDSEYYLVSFFEHLSSDDEVNRYVETYKELCKQQNRQDTYKGFGILSVTDSPEITNIKDSFISPFAWGCTIRCLLEDRDEIIETLYDLYGEMKGKVFDIAQYSVSNSLGGTSPKLVVMNSVGKKLVNNHPAISPNDFIGKVHVEQIEVVGSGEFADEPFTNSIVRRMLELEDDLNLTNTLSSGDYIYCEYKGTLRKVLVTISSGLAIYVSVENYGTFEKYCLDMAFDDISCQNPTTLNANEYCHITIGGKATLSSANVMLGNQMCLFAMREHNLDNEEQTSFIKELSGVNVDLSPLEYVDPAETSGALSTSQITSQLRSSLFIGKTHTDTISPTLQYTFVVDRNKHQVMKLYKYAKWGYRAVGVNYNATCVNTVYELHEIYSSWGEYEEKVIYAKLVENTPVEVSEADVVSITCNFTIQGDDDYLEEQTSAPIIEVR